MSKIEVDQVDPQSGTTLTLGTSGDTVNIPSGVTITNNGTQTGFGRTGTVDWQSTVKTATFTAANGEGYFCNTTAGGFTVNLPAGSAGAIVSVKDYLNTFGSNNLIIAPNGSDKIGGSTSNVTLSESGIAITLIFIDSTRGWLVTNSGLQSEAPQTYTADFLVIAGGGGGGAYPAGYSGGGGGAGGYRNSYSSESSGGGGSSESSLTFTSGTVYTVVVGGGGAVGSGDGGNATVGVNTSLSGTGITTITSSGGGGGGNGQSGETSGGPGGAGGSGGGGGCGRGSPGSGGTGGSGTSNQGFAGGAGRDHNGSDPNLQAGGGGGAAAVGGNGSASNGGAGGNGLSSSITGSSVARAGGGGGGSFNQTKGAAGTGGTASGDDGTANTGAGGGGSGSAGSAGTGGAGGSGVVILRMATANYSGTTSGSPTVTTDGSDTIIQFNGDGSYTA